MSKHHSIHTLVTLGLILTGVILYIPWLREPISSIRLHLRNLHLALGGAFFCSVIIYTYRFTANWPKLINQPFRKLSNLLAIALAVALALTGLLLAYNRSLPNLETLSSLKTHQILALIATLAVAYHAIAALTGFGQRTADSNSTASDIAMSDRKTFLRWVAVLGLTLSGGGLWNWLSERAPGPIGMKQAIKDCNRMTPEPTPSLGSSPPIGGGYQGNFEVFTVTPIPCANSDSWQFRLFGLADNPQTFSWQDFQQIPRRVQISNFHCVTGWSVHNITYEGIPLTRLMELAKIQPSVHFVKSYSADGIYTSALSLEQAQMEDVMIALLMDGQPIPSDFGGPARLIVPKMYAYKGVKWVNAIEFIAEPHSGYWESRGYKNDAWADLTK